MTVGSKNASMKLTVSVKQDGVWLNFCASTGKHASLRIESLGEERRGIIGRALLDWCADRRADADAPAQPRVRHKKRGSTYRVLGRGELQSSSPIEEGAMLVVYRCETDGRLWVRPAVEFDDGRFETLSDAPAMQTQNSDEVRDAMAEAEKALVSIANYTTVAEEYIIIGHMKNIAHVALAKLRSVQ